ncbi:MAG: Holliday junction resolvase RuvX [Mycoplasmatales bacterium]
MYSRILGIDYGQKRVGISLSDPLKIIAQDYGIIENTRGLFQEIDELCQKYNVEKIVIGLPLNMDGSCGFQAEEVKEFAEHFMDAYTVILVDERESSKKAKEIHKLKNKNFNSRTRIDSTAASVILQDYLDFQ